MARINIEDALFKDKRWAKLIIKLGDDEKALGALIRLWIIGQKYWKRNQARIPKHVWVEQDLNNALIETNWAKWDDGHNGYFCEGSETQFAWLLQKVESGQKGGTASGESRRNNSDSLSASEPKRSEAQASETKPPTPTLSPTLNSSSNSPSKGSRSPKAPAIIEGVDEVVAAYFDFYRATHKTDPARTGRMFGQLKQLTIDFGKAEAISLLQAYLKMQTKWFMTKGHDIETLNQNINVVKKYRDTGVMPSEADLNQLDKNQSLRNRVQNFQQRKA